MKVDLLRETRQLQKPPTQRARYTVGEQMHAARARASRRWWSHEEHRGVRACKRVAPSRVCVRLVHGRHHHHQTDGLFLQQHRMERDLGVSAPRGV